METLKFIVVGAIGSFIAAVINYYVARGINLWLVAGVGFVTATAALILAYRRLPGDPDFKIWRVTEDGKELRSTREFKINKKREGQPDEEVVVSFNGGFTHPGGAWFFTAKDSPANPVYGPYLKKKLSKKQEEKEEKPLRRGRYKAEFKIRVDGLGDKNRPIVDIDVASATRNFGDKRLAGRTLTASDFKKGDEYAIFSLEFEVIPDVILVDKDKGVYKGGESDLEFRIFSRGSGQRVYLDYVKFSRRLF
jgi:hypothetical protein